MIKHQLLIKSLVNLQTDMREVAIDLKHLYPDVSAGSQLASAADIISKWIEQIEKGNVEDE